MDWRLWKFLHYFHFDRVYWYVLENFSRPCVLCSTKCTTIYVSKTIVFVFVYVVKLLYSLPLYLSPCLCWQNKPVFMFVVVICLSGDEQGAAVLSLSVSHYVSWQNKPVPMFCCCCLLMSKEQLYCLSLSLTSHLFVDKTNRFRCFVVVVRWWARSSCTVSLYLLLCLLTTQTGVECLLLLFIRWWAKSSCSVSLSLLLCLLTVQTGSDVLLLLFIRWWAKSSCMIFSSRFSTSKSLSTSYSTTQCRYLKIWSQIF